MERVRRPVRATRLGFWLMAPVAYACEMGADLGYDLVVLDMEHGSIDGKTAAGLIAQGRQAGLEVYSRVKDASRATVEQMLVAGAHAVIVPQIRNVEHARDAAASARGKEGHVGRCILMIETQEAFDDVERIAQLAEVGGLFIGPGDLSRARGRGPNRDTPADFDDHRRIAAAARAARKPWSLSAESIQRQKFALDMQADFITVADDMSLLRSGLAAALAACSRS